ncbi:MAG TPA: hypothetical protein VN515_00250 [Terriglobales bacterium]|nr:hypothetical protein [Terriglobales bacterium]
MNDTSPWAEARLTELYRRLTPEERVRMVGSMFDAARTLVIAGIRRDYPGISERDLRRKVFERTYSSDFPPDEWARWLARWDAHEAQQEERSGA